MQKNSETVQPGQRSASSDWLKWVLGCSITAVLLCFLAAGGLWFNDALKPCRTLDLMLKRSGCEEITPLTNPSLLRLSKDGMVLAEYQGGFDSVQVLETNGGIIKELVYSGGNMVEVAHYDIALTSDGIYAAIIGSTTGNPHLGLVDLSQAQLELKIIPLPDGEYATRLALSPDDKRMAVAVDANSDYVAFFQVPSGEQIGRLDLMSDNFAVAYAPDGHVATAFNGQVQIWDVDDQSVVSSLGGQLSIVYSMVFSPDGNFLAVSSGDRYNSGGMVLDVFRLEDGQVIHHFVATGRSSVVYDPFPAAFSSDGKLVAVSSCDTGNVYRVSDGVLVATFTRQWDSRTFQYGDCLSTVHFTPDGKSVYYGWDNGGAVVKWRLP